VKKHVHCTELIKDKTQPHITLHTAR